VVRAKRPDNNCFIRRRPDIFTSLLRAVRTIRVSIRQTVNTVDEISNLEFPGPLPGKRPNSNHRRFSFTRSASDGSYHLNRPEPSTFSSAVVLGPPIERTNRRTRVFPVPYHSFATIVPKSNYGNIQSNLDRNLTESSHCHREDYSPRCSRIRVRRRSFFFFKNETQFDFDGQTITRFRRIYEEFVVR